MTCFDDIRPYNDEETQAAMKRFAESKEMIPFLNEFFPDKDALSLLESLKSIKSVYQFQHEVIIELVASILRQSTTGFECSGLDNIDKKRPFLFVSNHRDIVLDVMLLQYTFLVYGYNTCHIVFGNNLMFNPLVNDFWKVSKMIQINRGGSPKSFYNDLQHMSDYIHCLITEHNESVWIAQRNGRTKDGIDATDPAIIKMFELGAHGDRVANLAQLNIVPVAVSYEWEPCDKLKTIEVFKTRKEGHYEKQPGEDLNSVVTGIKQPKGKAHVHICEPLGMADLAAINDCTSGEFYRKVAKLMDQRIYANYVLSPNNYIAHDMRSRTTTFADHYTSEQKAQFELHMAWIDDCEPADQEGLRSIFLDIYAHPIDNINHSK